jgi:isopenicillin N synthase-like dioxygenase
MNIETIDFRSLDKERTQTQLARACRESGFFALSNHGLEDARQNSFLTQSETFFDQPLENKLCLERTAGNPFGFYNKELTKNRPDWKEVFDISLASQTPTHWPANAHFVQTMSEWSLDCHKIAMRVLEAIFATLDLSVESGFFQPDHTSFLRLNYYPQCPNPANEQSAQFLASDLDRSGSLGVNHHTDAGALTLLQQDRTPGLQFWLDNQWETAPADPSVLLVNLGDMLQVWSNDEYQAPVHRVLANSEQRRFSAPYFLNPAYSCDCKPLTEGVPLYRTVNWGDFRRRRADGDYADLGKEVQISDYRH